MRIKIDGSIEYNKPSAANVNACLHPKQAKKKVEQKRNRNHYHFCTWISKSELICSVRRFGQSRKRKKKWNNEINYNKITKPHKIPNRQTHIAIHMRTPKKNNDRAIQIWIIVIRRFFFSNQSLLTISAVLKLHFFSVAHFI